MVSRLVSTYLKYLNSHPWTTTSVATGFFCGFGDVIAQQGIEKRGLKNHNIRRTLKMTSIGLFVVGPGIRKWYLILEKLAPGSGSKQTIKKVVLDQLLWAPAINCTVFVLSDKIDGKTNEQVKTNLSTNYIQTMKVNYLIWPGVQLANFYFVPFQHRILVVNVVVVFWNTFLAWMVNKKQES